MAIDLKRTSPKTAEIIGTNRGKVEKARIILDHAKPETIKAVEQNEISINKAYQQTQQERKVKQEEQTQQGSVFSSTNDNIEWAKWTWNPVTGCKHNCSYCYARDKAKLLYNHDFEPLFHPKRLTAPENTKPRSSEPGGSAVFVCSMADLFGEWVPNEWISKVMEQVEKNPQWTFIFLTKNPARLASVQFPDNAWVGTTVDCQERASIAEEAMKKVSARVRFVSCEPMLEEITFKDMSAIDWVIIGGKSASTRESAFQPQWEWVYKLTHQAIQSGCKVYWKPNLTVRPKEYPRSAFE